MYRGGSMKKSYALFFFLCFIFFPCVVLAENLYSSKTPISFNSSWEYASFSKIHSGQSVLYKTASNSNGHTVAINAGHGTRGGTSVKTLSHPDGTAKVSGGTNAAGAVESYAISSGMDFNDGTSEATVTLKMAEKTRDLLLQNGFDVLMIRDASDVQLDNIARTVIANNNADIHLAIHWDGDGLSYDKGIFFMSVVDDDSYRNMEPVKSHYQEHDALGRKIISVMKSDGIKVHGNGEMPNDLTQTSYSTIPSIDIEFGNQSSSHDDATLNTLANAFVHGISEYFDTSFTPSNGGSGSSNTVSSTLNLNEYSLTSEQRSTLEEAMKSWPSEIEAGRLEVIKKALSLIGKGILYDKGSRAHPENPNPKYHDCSSYVSWAFYQGGFNIGLKTTPEFAADTANFSEINKSDLIPGDIALNSRNGGGDTGTVNHVGIYFGNANGKNVYLHSTNHNGVSGPQIRHGEGNFKVYFRYTKFGDEMTSVSSGSSSSGGSTGYVSQGLQDDKYKGNGFKEIETEDITCRNVFMDDDGELNELGEFVQGLFTLIKIAAPALVIILSTIDYVKAIANSDDSEMKKVTPKVIKRVIFGVLVFLLPFLLDLVFHLFGLYDLSTCGIGGNIEEIYEDPGD